MLVRLRPAWFGLALLTTLSGCEGGGVGAGDVLVVAQVEITPPDPTIVTGSSRQLQANPRTSSGITVPNRQVTWSSDDLGILTVSASGMVTAVALGDTRVNATVDGVRGSIRLQVTPKPVATISVVPDQITLVVGATTALTATPRDEDGQPVSGQAITFSSDNPLIATVSPAGQVTAVALGLTVVRAIAGGKTGSANVAVNSLPATQLNFESVPVTAPAGEALPPVRIAVQNDQGGTVTEGSIPVTVDLGGNPTGAVLSGTRTREAVNGVAIFTDLRVNQAGSGYTLRATSGTLLPAESAPFAVVAGAPALLSVATEPSPVASSGAALPRQPQIQIRDASGNAVAQAGVQVTAALEGAGGTLAGTRSITTNAQGVAAFTDLVITGSAGTYTLLFASPGLTAVASSGIMISGTPSTLVLEQQPSADAQVGALLDRQPIVRVGDSEGNAVALAGLAITATINSGGGTLGGTTTVNTDASGRAAFTNLSIGGAPGPRTIRFSAASLAPVVSGVVAVGAGNPAALAFATSPPPATTSGDVLSPAPAVRVVDAFGNPVTPSAEISVAVTIATGSGGSLAGPTSVTTSGGVATFPGLILAGPNGAYTLRFSGGGLTPVVSGNIVIGPGTPTALTIVTQPSSSSESGSAFAVQPVVQVRDGLGNPVPQSGIVVTATIASGGGTLGGTVSRQTDASGQASFTNLMITGTPGPRTLRFAANGLASATSTPIAVTAPPPSSLKITTQPAATTESGVALVRQPVIEVTNKFNEPVPAITITAQINSGPAGASLSGTTAQSNASGLAAFSNLTLSGQPGDYTIRFVTANLSVTSGIVKIRAKPEKLLLSTSPASNAASGVAFAAQPVVQLVDKDNQPVDESGTTVTAEIVLGPSGATLSGGSAVSNGSGAAVFTGLTISGPTGIYRLRFSSGTLTPVTTGNITLGAGAPASVTIVDQPPNSAENDEQFDDAPEVRVQDAAGNVVPNVAVTVGIASGQGTLKGTLTRTTGGNGRVDFPGLSLVGLVGSYSLSFTSGGVSVVSRSINLTPGQAEVLGIQAQPPSSVGSNREFTVLVELRDTGGNLVRRNGVRVGASLERLTGFGDLNGDTSVQTDNGVAEFDELRIFGSGTFRIRFTSQGMTAVSTAVITVSF